MIVIVVACVIYVAIYVIRTRTTLVVGDACRAVFVDTDEEVHLGALSDDLVHLHANVVGVVAGREDHLRQGNLVRLRAGWVPLEVNSRAVTGC